MSTATALDRRGALGADLVNGHTVSAPEAAWLLDVHHQCIWRLASNRWGRLVGSGHRLRLDLVDLMVLRALTVINGIGRGSYNPAQKLPLDRAEQAVRADPRRWLLVWPDGASTHDDTEDCARAVIAGRHPSGSVIDLWGWM